MTPLQSFAGFLNERRPEDEKVLVAMRFYMSEITDDKLPRELAGEMQEAIGHERQVHAALAQLEGNRAEQVHIALAFLAHRWEEPAERDRIIRAFDGAATKLLVVESGLIAMISMYAMFLIATGGRRKTTRTVVRKPDGRFEETVTEEMFGPSGPLQAIVSLFTGNAAKTEGQ
jgi:hypothetical protein